MAGTAADLLGYMKILNNELRVASGGADESRALTALQMAQHHFETLCADRPRVLQSTVNVSTAANTEKSTWPTSLLRLDAVWLLGSDGRPIQKIKRITEIGGHVPSLPWPMNLVTLAVGSGQVAGYYGNMADFYWMPLPDGVQTMRLYGFIEQTEIATRATAFNYPNRVKTAIAAFAVKLLRVGVDDDAEAVEGVAAQFYTPLLRSLQRFDRSEPQPRYYSDVHTT